MRTRVQKWGNSLALRIPKSFAAETRLQQDTLVDVSLVDGTLVVAPVAEPGFTLEHLLAGVTPENLHAEFETGPAAGQEAW
jgi:antitoxin MazE